MESWFSLNSIVTVALLLPIILLAIEKCQKSKANVSHKLPPGPTKKLPIVGDLHRLSAVPFRNFADLAQKYGPIMHLKLGEVPTIVISSAEIAKEVLKEHDPNFADRPRSIGFEIMSYGYLDVAYSQYGDYWRQMRRIIILEMLSAKCVRSFGNIRDDEISRLVKSIQVSSASGQPINLTKKIFSMTSSIACRAAFGKVCKDVDTLIKVMKEGIELAGGFELADLFPSWKIINKLSWTRIRLLRLRRNIDMILDSIIDEHKENFAKMAENLNDSARRGNGEFGDEDLVDVLLRVKETQELQFPINNDHIKAILFEMFFGGTDTGAATIDWTMVELLRNPQVMAKAQAEVRQVFKGSKTINQEDVHKLKYLKFVMMESMRLHPVTPIIPRASREERKINGYTIPAKVKVVLNTWAIHRDPNYWTNPERFEPERFETGSVNFARGDFQFLPFGSGRRMCPGMTYALANVELCLAHILYNFNWHLPHDIKAEALDMTEKFGATTSRNDELFVVATAYKSLA